jgi:DNA-binding MarR family transcriptional regulator
MVTDPAETASRDDPEELMLGILLADVLRLMRQDFAARTRAMPLSPALHRLLLYVQRRPGSRQVELAEWLDVTPVTVGRMIDRLERQNLVRRENHPADRRATCVYVGEGAAELLASLGAKAHDTRQRAVDGLTAQQRKDLITALAKVRANLATPPARNSGPARTPK